MRYRVGEGAYIVIPRFRDHQYLSVDERKKHSEIPAQPGTGDLEATTHAVCDDHEAAPVNLVPIAGIVEAWNAIAVPSGAVACRKVPDAWKGAIRTRWVKAIPSRCVACSQWRRCRCRTRHGRS